MSCDILLVRGLIREAGHWADLLPSLKKQFPDSEILCIDLPGAGVKYQQESPTSIEEIVTEMRADWRSKRKSKRPCIIVAISLGGMIAAEWMNLYSKDFAGAVLMNTSYAGYSKITERLKLSALGFLLKVPTLKGEAKEKRILELVVNDPNKRVELLPLWTKIQNERPVSLSNTLKQLWAAKQFHIGEFVPRIPILILASENDRMVDVSCSKSIAENWKAPIVFHPTAGHDLSSDDPEWTSEQIKQWVDSKFTS
jgi:pimeloyl-ACP methyl ester carboxylesterase